MEIPHESHDHPWLVITFLLRFSNGFMANICQDEPDEDSGPELFQNEPDENRHSLFGEEPEERDALRPSSSSRPRSHKECGLSLLQDEPDEAPHHQPLRASLFGVEQDELEQNGCSSGSDDSAYSGDCEKEKTDAYNIVQLNFSTLSKFLTSQLSTAGSTTSKEPIKKKRRYNNQNRMKAADERKLNKESTVKQRVPRNCPETLMGNYWI